MNVSMVKKLIQCAMERTKKCEIVTAAIAQSRFFVQKSKNEHFNGKNNLSFKAIRNSLNSCNKIKTNK